MRVRSTRSVRLGLCMLLMAAGTAAGQQPDDAPAAASEHDESIEEFPVRGVRTGLFGSGPSTFSSTVQVDDFDGERKSLEEILALQPGVQIRRFGGPGSPSEISIRGSTASQVGVLLDGVRVNSVLSVFELWIVMEEMHYQSEHNLAKSGFRN